MKKDKSTVSLLLSSVTCFIIALTMLGAVVVISLIKYANVLLAVLTILGSALLIESYIGYRLYETYKEINEKYGELGKILKETKDEINSHKNSTH